MRHKLSSFLARNWRTVLNIVTFLALGLLIFAARDQIAETIYNIQHVKYWVLGFIIPLYVLDYHAYAKMYKHILAFLGYKVAYRQMYRLALELTFINNVFPSGGVSGISYFGIRLKQFGIGAGVSTLTQLTKFILIFTGFQVLLAFGLLSLAINGEASNLVILIAGTLSTGLFFGTLLLAYIIGDKRRINSFFLFFTNILNRLLHTIRPHHPETIETSKVKEWLTELHDNYLLMKGNFAGLKAPFWYALLVSTCEIAVIYVVYIAFGQYVNLGAVIIAYAIANFAGLISVLPGGVGIYEALMTGVLAAAGVPPGVSIPVTIMYRILSMLVQLPVGFYLYHDAVRKGAEPVHVQRPYSNE